MAQRLYEVNNETTQGYNVLSEAPTNCTGKLNETCNITDAATHIIGAFTQNPEAYAIPIVFAVIFLVGVIGNGTLIYIVARNKNMRNAPNIFIVSLALGDLLLILVSVPFTATIYTFSEWPYGEVMCKLNEFLQALSLGVSVFTLMALSFDRYVAIVDPMKRHRTSSTKMTLFTAAAIWVLSAGLATLELVAAHITYQKYPGKILEICAIHPINWGSWYPQFHTLFRFFLYFAMPMVVIGVFYLLMAHILVVSSKRMPGDPEGKANQHHKQMEARKKVAKVVLSFVIVFVCCWLPRHIYTLWYFFDPNEYNLFWHVFKILGFCLSFINSCVNPMALYFLSKQFRIYYNKYLFCCVPREPRRPQMDYSTMYNFNSTVRRTSTTMTMLPSQSVC